MSQTTVPYRGETAAPGSLITLDGQVQWAGLLMGPGTPYGIASEGLTGWADLPALDTGDVVRPDQHGAWPGAQWAQPRSVGATVWLLPESADRASATAEALLTATGVRAGEEWLAVRLHGQTLACRARIGQRVVPTNRAFATQGATKVALQWVCADPRRYSVDERSVRTQLPAPEPGLSWQAAGLEWPLDWGLAGSTGNLTVVNEGDAPTAPLIEFRGPVQRPSLTRMSDNRQLQYDIELADSDVLTVDTTAGTVTLNGTASRIHTAMATSLPEHLFQLEPGETALAFRAAPGPVDPRASVTVTWRDARW
ncbi:phage distal tail protein [Streptomyces sp. URMC 123]|uniref:phage distal tail protein n=1 Tax=Streptomyces sp. URMC 123 TaxID=3423403 RepID=UPI003F1BFCC4